MNWNNQLAESALWLLNIGLYTLFAGGLIMTALARYTVWGRQFWRLAHDYFLPEHTRRAGLLAQLMAGLGVMLLTTLLPHLAPTFAHQAPVIASNTTLLHNAGLGLSAAMALGLLWQLRRSKPILWIIGIALITLAGVKLGVLLSFWSNGFYTAIQNYDQKGFWFGIALFSLLASLHVARSLFNAYIRTALEIHWRQSLNHSLIDRWLNHAAYYGIQFLSTPVDNPDQRIQQDVSDFVSTSLQLAMGLLDALVSLVEFTVVLWALSGTLAVFGLEIPRAMVWISYGYVIIATLFAFWVGRPLIGLTFLKEKLGANFRYTLVRLREYRESIAFYRGEAIERRTLDAHFNHVIQNTWRLLYRGLKFDGLNLSFSQAAVIFPFLIQAPRYFAKEIKMGDLMQTARAFGELQDALSFFRSSYDSFAAYRAILDRLTGFLDAIAAADALPKPLIRDQAEAVSTQHLNLATPNQTPLLHDLSIRVLPGEPLLVRGKSGAGKTTLLRALAGLWPFTTGDIAAPQGSAALFLSQKPYLPLGSLRTALCYPCNADHVAEAAVLAALADCDLSQFSDQLDVIADWSQTLSLGEQQRLAFARILINAPRAVFLDEATSAMDEPLELAMYRLLQTKLPETIVISVGHRSTLRALHRHELTCLGEGKWSIGPITDAAA